MLCQMFETLVPKDNPIKNVSSFVFIYRWNEKLKS